MYLDTSKEKRYSKNMLQKIKCVPRCTSGELRRGGLQRENRCQEEGRLGRQRGKERKGEKGRVEVERDPER